jgi:hypothetical protein
VTCATTAPTTYTVGGSVSGLVSGGNVVLENNGGNDQTVAANGSFTFSAALATGAAYSVTVKINPPGQTCTVAGGSGTIAAANVTTVAVTCATTGGGAGGTGAGTDDFNRANGALGSNWTATSDGPLTIASQVVKGGNGAYSGDLRSAETYTSDQSSQVEVTATQLSGGQWIGPAVRAQNGGSSLYLGIYFWNSGSPDLMLFKRINGGWTQLGSSYPVSALAAGTQLKLTVVGSTLTFAQNGTARITATDTSLTAGSPGIMAYGTGTADNWAGASLGTSSGGGTGGSGGLTVTYVGTDANGVKSYDMLSSEDGGSTEVLRVLAPTNPAAGVKHNFLFAMPVESGEGSTYGDGIATVEAAGLQNQYNLTVIEPAFPTDPWYADNPTNANMQYETFLTTQLVPWVKANLSVTGTEQNWLIGFSKSGIGTQDLLLKHPDLFSVAASWDFPADMSTYDGDDPYGTVGGGSAGNYGTDANFQANYRLSSSFLTAHKAAFTSANRIWIGSYAAFGSDMTDYDALLTQLGIQHTTETPTYMAHRWDSGWVPLALAALEQDSQALGS